MNDELMIAGFTFNPNNMIEDSLNERPIYRAAKDFTAWLRLQRKQDSWLGDFADDWTEDKRKPLQVESLQDVLKHLNARNACREAKETAAEAWKRFKKYQVQSAMYAAKKAEKAK